MQISTNMFRTNRMEIPFDSFNEVHYLLPFGDIHRDSPNCDIDLWKDFCKWGATKPRTTFVGMGDYFDSHSGSERAGMRSINLHDTTIFNNDQTMRANVEVFAKEIGFMRGKILGLMEGNHHYEFADGTTSTQYLCTLMECKYLSCVSLMRLVFKYNKKGNKSAAVMVLAYHGKGASRLVGGSLNTVQQMTEIANANVYLMGHDHKKGCAMASKFEWSDNSNSHIREVKQLFARTGSFLQGYVEDKPSYVVEKLLNPTDLGTVKIELTPKCTRTGGMKIDIHGSI